MTHLNRSIPKHTSIQLIKHDTTQKRAVGLSIALKHLAEKTDNFEANGAQTGISKVFQKLRADALARANLRLVQG
jgi:hypothetical protein